MSAGASGPNRDIRQTARGFAIAAVSSGLFIIDIFTPRGTAEASLYVLVVLISFALSDRGILATAAGTSALAIAGFFVSPQALGTSLWIALLNRSVAFTVIWITALLGLQRARGLRRERQQARRWETTVTSIGDAVVVTDHRGVVTYLNRVAEQLTGWSLAEASGMPLERVFRIINEQTRQPVDNPVARVVREGRIVGLANHTLLVRKDGGEVPIDDSAAPIFDASNELTGVVLVFRDVTAGRQAERQLREGVQMLSEADRLKDTFLAILAHELRQPLNALHAAAGVLKVGSLSNDHHRAADVIDRQVTYLARLVADLTDASQVKRGKLRLTLGTVDLREVLAATVETLKPTVSANGQRLVLRLPNEPISIQADGDRLRQVFSNLIVNACSHTPTDGRIEVQASLDGTRACVRVRDNGRGIPPGLVSHVFDLFVQGEDGRIGAGMGIGLALVKGIVELHGGEVAVHSAGEGQGSEFTVKLPKAPEPQAAPETLGNR